MATTYQRYLRQTSRAERHMATTPLVDDAVLIPQEGRLERGRIYDVEGDTVTVVNADGSYATGVPSYMVEPRLTCWLLNIYAKPTRRAS